MATTVPKEVSSDILLLVSAKVLPEVYLLGVEGWGLVLQGFRGKIPPNTRL